MKALLDLDSSIRTRVGESEKLIIPGIVGKPLPFPAGRLPLLRQGTVGDHRDIAAEVCDRCSARLVAQTVKPLDQAQLNDRGELEIAPLSAAENAFDDRLRLFRQQTRQLLLRFLL